MRRFVRSSTPRAAGPTTSPGRRSTFRHVEQGCNYAALSFCPAIITFRHRPLYRSDDGREDNLYTKSDYTSYDVVAPTIRVGVWCRSDGDVGLECRRQFVFSGSWHWWCVLRGSGCEIIACWQYSDSRPYDTGLSAKLTGLQ